MDYGQAKKRRKTESNASINALPDDLSAGFFSQLDTLSAFCMSRVSHRWHQIWSSAPLSLDDCQLRGLDIPSRVKLLKHLINSHQGPIGCVSWSFISLVSLIRHFEPLFRKPLFDELSILMLHFPGKSVRTDRKVLPATMLRFQAVRKLHLTNCVIRDGTQLSSACLVELKLCSVHLPGDTLQNILSECPYIESLTLLWNSGYESLIVQLPKLHTLFVRLVADDNYDDMELQSLVIENAVNLRQLYINQHALGPTVVISGGASLRALGYFGQETPELQLGNSVFKQSIATRLADFFPNVMILALKMLVRDSHGVGHIIDFLCCFPSLEVLHVSFVNDAFTYCYPQDTNECGASIYDPYGSMACLHNTLKTVALWNYPDEDEDDVRLDISRYFAERGIVLERLILGSARKLNFKYIERLCRESFGPQRVSPFKVCLALVQKDDLKEMRQGDPFSLGSIYKEIVVMPQVPNVEDNYDGATDENDDDGRDGNSESNLLHSAEDGRFSKSGGSFQIKSAFSGHESSSSEASQGRHTRKDLSLTLEDHKEMWLLLCEDKREVKITLSESVVTLQEKTSNAGEHSSQSMYIIGVVLESLSTASQEGEDWLKNGHTTSAPHQYFKACPEELLRMKQAPAVVA